jgi:hypothetical protein
VGNTNDWEILYSLECAKVNSVELLIHKELSRYQIKGNQYGNTESKEIFRCSYQKTREFVDKVIAENDINIIKQNSYVFNTDKYKFRNLISK